MSGSQKHQLKLAQILIVMALVAGLIGFVILRSRGKSDYSGFVKGNGRLEASEIEIASMNAGRVDDVLVKEGDPVFAGQVVANMDAQVIDAQLAEATAKVADAESGKATALALVIQARSSLQAANALRSQQSIYLENAQKTYERTKALFASGVSTQQELDNDQAAYSTALSKLDAALAQESQARAELEVAKTRVSQAEAQVEAAKATVKKITINRDDSSLKAPSDGRIQRQMARPGEVIGAGGIVLEMIDMSDVYMTIFLPTKATGCIAIGDEARIILDSLPGFPIPATISYVASEAQFTPKTVETADERDDLVFEVRLSVKKTVIDKYGAYAKVGLPGVGYVRTKPDADWPADLELKSAPSTRK